MHGASAQIELQERLDTALALLDRSDRSSALHRRAVARYANAIAVGVGLPPGRRELLRVAALLHDVGKLSLPARILAGAAPLSEQEWELVRAHPRHGAALVARLGGGEELAAIVATHHEHVDGGGYPAGLQGTEIPALARIVAVAEAYDALTAEHSYRVRVSSLEALRRLSRAAGTQLEPRYVEILVGALAGGGLR